MEALGPPCTFRGSSSDVVQVRLQSCKTRLTAASRLGATLLWQVDDLTLPSPGSELVTVNEHNDGPGAHLVGVLCRMGLAAFSRLGPLALQTGLVGSA